eukprot:m.119789 g.119789  ORF g.119789 m.119789 type:complete len:109 (+) comp37710_c0_seq15:186-512(+)
MVCSSRRSPSATCKNTDRICQSVYSNLRTIPDNSTVTCTNRVLWQSLGDSWTESTSTDYSICPASALALAVIQGRHERVAYELILEAFLSQTAMWQGQGIYLMLGYIL